jgi:tuftelin-interacting protein 11
MIVDLAKGELDGLAREGHAIKERKKWVDNEEKRLRTKVSEEADCEHVGIPICLS